MPTKWLQERRDGSKNEDGIPPHRDLCGRTPARASARRSGAKSSVTEISSDTMHLSISFRKSSPPQNCQLSILISSNNQQVDDFGGELNTFCETRWEYPGGACVEGEEVKGRPPSNWREAFGPAACTEHPELREHCLRFQACELEYFRR